MNPDKHITTESWANVKHGTKMVMEGYDRSGEPFKITFMRIFVSGWNEALATTIYEANKWIRDGVCIENISIEHIKYPSQMEVA